jgi:hypothetical protein
VQRVGAAGALAREAEDPAAQAEAAEGQAAVGVRPARPAAGLARRVLELVRQAAGPQGMRVSLGQVLEARRRAEQVAMGGALIPCWLGLAQSQVALPLQEASPRCVRGAG